MISNIANLPRNLMSFAIFIREAEIVFNAPLLSIKASRAADNKRTVCKVISFYD